VTTSMSPQMQHRKMHASECLRACMWQAAFQLLTVSGGSEVVVESSTRKAGKNQNKWSRGEEQPLKPTSENLCTPSHNCEDTIFTFVVAVTPSLIPQQIKK